VEKTRRAEVVPIRCCGGGPDSSTWCHASVHQEHRPSHAADIATTAPRTPPAGHPRTAGLKTHSSATPAHRPLGRPEGLAAHVRVQHRRWDHPPHFRHPPTTPRATRVRVRESVTCPICKKTAIPVWRIHLAQSPRLAGFRLLPRPSGQPRSGNNRKGDPRADRRALGIGALMRRSISPPQVTHLARNQRRASPE
jgi:hypothetical protein